MDPRPRQPDPIPPHLGLWDAVSIIVGIIIGVGIFETPDFIFAEVPGPWEAIGVWVLGGALALIGALCFAELASTYPRSGGDYVYLTRAFGSGTGFLFAWAQLSVIRPGSIAALAYILADYATNLWDLGSPGKAGLAISAIIMLTLINFLGVTLGRRTQNLLTLAKIAGLGAILWAGFFLAAPGPELKPGIAANSGGWFGPAMVFVLWTYAGWHEAAYVAAEVRNRRRNLPLALILGTALVTLIYVLVNVAFLVGLGFEQARSPRIAAAAVLEGMAGSRGTQFLSVLVIISALGAINGTIFTTARIYAEFGKDHRLFHPLSHWSRRLGTPARALAVQGIIALALALAVGVVGGGREEFNTLVVYTAAVFWLFFLLTGVALFQLRRQEPQLERPFRVPGYPILPLIFCGWCGYMVIAAILYDPVKSLIGLAITLAGWPLFFLPQKLRARKSQPFQEDFGTPREVLHTR